MIYPIILYKKGKKILRRKSSNVKKNINILELTNNMFQTMYYYDGVGLSAPQVGININLFIIKKNKMIIINPRILKYSNKKISSKEGCLSLPNIYVNILRYKSIYIKYYDQNWIEKEKKLNDFISIVFQHEYDHLNGKLILDYK